MLAMLYALQECFDRVKSFVFIDEPVEVTHYFDDFDIERALEDILHSPDIAHGAATDYGRTLRLFKARHMDTINKKTTVIIIGDGRTNYGNPEEGILEEMRDRSRRIIAIAVRAYLFCEGPGHRGRRLHWLSSFARFA